MKIIFVGGGAATLFATNLLIKKKKDAEIIIVDKKAKLGRKLSMTGNGKCNLSPLNDDIKAYNHPEFVKVLFDEIPLKEYLKTINSFGIPTKTIRNQGYYPNSENATNVVDILIGNLLRNKVQIINDEVIEYQHNILRLKNTGEIKGDKIVFACGGKSYPDSGSDGNIFPILMKHGYDIKPLNPSLCPVKVKENIKDLFGARNHALISLIKKEKVLYQEDGEIMFKKDALSGIAMMNISSYICHHPDNYQIKIDFLNNVDFIINENASCLDTLCGYVSKPIAEYILKIAKINFRDLAKLHQKELQHYLANLTFTYDRLYDFSSAQVTSGGISLKEIDDNFMSKKEKDIYFIGEMLDIDGLCGGYNLRFAITSGFKMVKKI